MKAVQDAAKSDQYCTADSGGRELADHAAIDGGWDIRGFGPKP